MKKEYWIIIIIIVLLLVIGIFIFKVAKSDNKKDTTSDQDKGSLPTPPQDTESGETNLQTSEDVFKEIDDTLLFTE